MDTDLTELYEHELDERITEVEDQLTFLDEYDAPKSRAEAEETRAALLRERARRTAPRAPKQKPPEPDPEPTLTADQLEAMLAKVDEASVEADDLLAELERPRRAGLRPCIGHRRAPRCDPSAGQPDHRMRHPRVEPPSAG
jgi:multidrug efflux pump subunit AcrA (membrane-fusion protein)